MNENDIIQTLIKELSNVFVSANGDDKIITIPFNDYASDSIQVNIFIMGNELVIDDLGRIAGLLFTLGQQTEDTPAFQLVRNLADSYGITMDFDQGVLKQTIQMPDDINKFIDFTKVITSLQVAIPELRQRKAKIEKSKLVSRLSHDIKQLKLRLPIEKQAQVIGKNEIWPVNFKYEKAGEKGTEVLIVAADLATKDPRQKAASIVASAIDLMQINRDLRIVYEVDGIGRFPEVKRAQNLIDLNQKEFHYMAFNYADKIQKDELLVLTQKDACPII